MPDLPSSLAPREGPYSPAPTQSRQGLCRAEAEQAARNPTPTQPRQRGQPQLDGAPRLLYSCDGPERLSPCAKHSSRGRGERLTASPERRLACQKHRNTPRQRPILDRKSVV